MPTPSPSKSLSTADARRDTVLSSAIIAFARQGYMATPVAAVAEQAGISTAYVFKLFPSKESLFAAALERCFALIEDALARGLESSTDKTPDGLLAAMSVSYASLIADRNLLTLQVHALSAIAVPEINAAFRKGLGNITNFLKTRTGASDDAVQQFIAYGQLCHLITTLSLSGDEAPWAGILTQHMHHL